MRIKGRECEAGDGKKSELLRVAILVPIMFCTARQNGEVGGGCNGESKEKNPWKARDEAQESAVKE